jgi:hypothetical protein
MSVILATWEAEVGRIEVPGQPGQIAPETPSPKFPEQNLVSSGRVPALQV